MIHHDEIMMNDEHSFPHCYGVLLNLWKSFRFGGTFANTKISKTLNKRYSLVMIAGRSSKNLNRKQKIAVLTTSSTARIYGRPPMIIDFDGAALTHNN